MLVPKPPFKLEGHCSVIHNNTLYTFSSNRFASIALERNGKWSILKPGVPVSGAACVTAGTNGTHGGEALYVVGGTGPDSYTGLQRYSFHDKKWETLHPGTNVTKNRTKHGVAYMKSASAILVYAGSREGSTVPSSHTFLIDAAPPHSISSLSPKNPSPAILPNLLPWSDDKVALIGGMIDPKTVHIFHVFNSTYGEWQESKIHLPHEIPDDVRCALRKGSNGSRTLETFDMSVSPNSVTSISLRSAYGNPVKHGKGAGGHSRKRRRDGTLKDRADHNDQFAPTSIRENYALAQGDNGLVVISSGRGTDSLAIFNQTSGGWVNTTKLFYGDKPRQQILGQTTTSSSTPTSSSSSSSSAAAAPSDDSSDNVGTIIGATLGSILGFAAILLVILFFLNRVKKKRAAQAGGDSKDKDRLSFQDQGVEPLAQSAYPMAKSPVPVAHNSVDSLDIFTGRAGEKTPKPAGLTPAYAQRAAPRKNTPLTAVQSSGEVDPNDQGYDAKRGRPGTRTTDEGWSKYFEHNNSAQNLAVQSDRSISETELSNPEPKGNAWPMKPLTRLNFDFLDGPTPMGHVSTGSPTTEHSPTGRDGRSLIIPQGQSARISTGESLSSNSDDGEFEDAPPSINGDGPWGAQSWLDRPASSTYSSVLNAPSGRGMSTATGVSNRQSSLLTPEHDGPSRDNINSDMSWLNIHADR